MRAGIRLMLMNREKLMGPGTKILLENIETTHSIKEASRVMEMSYTKALRILQTLERELGYSVVISQKGGIQRGGTQLTLEGEKVLRAYEEIEQKVLAYAQALVDEKFEA